MLRIKTLRADVDMVMEHLEGRDVDRETIESFQSIDETWRSVKQKLDTKRARRNDLTDEVETHMQNGEEDAAQPLIEEAQEVKNEIQELETRMQTLREERTDAWLRIPNKPASDVPYGVDEDDNVEHYRRGFDSLRGLPDTVIPHYELGKQLNILDEERGAKTTGSGFYFMKGEGARLQRALIQFMMDMHQENGFEQVIPPVPVRSQSMTGTGQLPKFADDAYALEEEDLWLCPTAEVPVTNMYRDDILLADDLPLKHQAYTPNFRREAGESGTATRGIARVHQFDKVELVKFVEPSESPAEHEALLQEAEAVLDALGLPFRTIELCTGDLPFASSKTYDIEVWAPADDMDDGPAQGGRWLEVSSVSNFRGFQARRANLKYRPEEHESVEYLHTLNGSGVALPRIVIAILECYQNEDGTVTIPEPLRPYMGGQERITGHDRVGESARGS